MPWVKVIWGAVVSMGDHLALTVVVQGLRNTLASLVQHVFCEVNNLNLDIPRSKFLPCAIKETESDVSGSAGYVEALERSWCRCGLPRVAVKTRGKAGEHSGNKVVLP